MYVNTYILSVPEQKKSDYLHLAETFAEVAKDFGVLEIFENWELDIPDGEHTDYRKAVKAQPGEKIVLSIVVWPDRKTAALAHKGIFADQRMIDIKELPFDGKRMILGGFAPLLTYRRK